MLIFNEGDTFARTELLAGRSLGAFSANEIVFGTTFAVGQELSNGVFNGPTGVTMRMALAPEDVPPAGVPEPATLALLGLGFARRKT